MKNRSGTYRKTRETLPLEADLSTHLTQGVEDVIKEACMFVVNIFLNALWIGFKRLCG
jgi:hypothetical protein